MRICTAVAVLIGQAFAQRDEFCGTATLLDQTSLLQNLQVQKNVAIQDVGELQTTSAEHMFDQAVAVLQNVQNTPGIAAFADDIRSQITADDGFLAAIQAAHAADQLELVGLWAEVVSSMTAAQDQIKEIEHVQSDVGIVATSHGICRQDEFPMCMVVDDCHVRLEDAEAELITAESVVSSTQTAIKTSWCGNDGSMQLAFRDGARPILSTYLSQEIIADTKRAARDAIQSECEAKEVLRLAKRAECNSVQVHFEVQSCQLATLIRHSSDMTEQQVHAATTAYQTARTDVEAQEEIRKKEFLTLTRTECLLDRIHEAGELPCDENTSNQNDVAAQATACHNIEVDTSSLDITYNDVQTVPPFPAVPSSPCDGDFISSHYDDLTDRFSSCGGPNECTPCENAPEPPSQCQASDCSASIAKASPPTHCSGAVCTQSECCEDPRLTAYWEYGSCGPGGNDFNANWCGGIRLGQCPHEVTLPNTEICQSGGASLMSFHGQERTSPPAVGLAMNGCNYLWFAQYECVAPVASCTEAGTKWNPINMGGEGRTVEESASACQARCAARTGCAHFSFWPHDGGCHIQDATATRAGNPNAVSGPNVCDVHVLQD